MIRPLIAITTGTGPSRAVERASINAAYLNALQAAGAVPIILTPPFDVHTVRQLVDTVEAVVLTGGGDVDPARYGEARHELTDGVSEERDALELATIELALERELPVLAICRGLQILNVALGGSLHQDIPSEFATDINHAQTSGDSPYQRCDVTHGVAVEEGCRLAGLLGSSSIQVNSMHHQSTNRVGRDLKAVAWAPDGVVEGLELEDAKRWVVAVQWHPEELVSTHEHARRLFEAVVREAEARRG